MKKFLILLLLVGCTNDPVYEPEIEYTSKRIDTVIDNAPMYAYEGYVRNTGKTDIGRILPKITFDGEVSYGHIGDRQDQIFSGVKNATTVLRRGEERYYFVKTRVLTNIPVGTEPEGMKLSFEVSR